MSARTQQTRRTWTTTDDALLRERYPHEPTAALARALHRTNTSVYQRAHHLGVRKRAAYLASPAAWRFRRGAPVGVEHRFQPGQVPHNQGLRHPPGWAPGRMADTQFKPGQLSGRAEALLAPVGTEVIDPGGYRKRKVRADAMPGQSRQNWAFVHVLVWEAAHGPVPAGHAVVFRNGNKADIRIGNLELITRAELMRRNTVHRFPPELKSAIRAVSKLNKTIRQKSRQAEEATA